MYCWVRRQLVYLYPLQRKERVDVLALGTIFALHLIKTELLLGWMVGRMERLSHDHVCIYLLMFLFAAGTPWTERQMACHLSVHYTKNYINDIAFMEAEIHFKSCFSVLLGSSRYQVGPQSSDRAIERASDREIERSSAPSSVRSSEPTIERSTERSSDRANDWASERSSDPAIQRSSDRAIERSSDRAIQQSSERLSDRAIQRSNRRMIERACDRAIERAIDRAT